MSAKYTTLVEQFNPTTVTTATFQTQLATRLNAGWEYKQSIFFTATKAFIIFTKQVTA
jgi:hypothetical protein